MGRKLGDPGDPLLVSVRSGAKFSMPGMMDTVLNLGLNDESVQRPGQADLGRALRLRLLPALRLHVRAHRPRHRRPRSSTEPFEEAKARAGVDNDAEIPAEELAKLVEEYKTVVERRHRRGLPPAAPASSSAAPSRPCSARGTGLGPSPTASASGSPTTSAPPSTSSPWCSATATTTPGRGWGSPVTRPPVRWASYGDFLINAQGEDVVAGIRNTLPLAALKDRFPKIYRELMDIFARLEAHYRDMCDTEFTIEQGKLWMLQTRVGKRTGAAALKMAVDMTKQRAWKISRAEAVQRVTRRAPRPGPPSAVRRPSSST